MNLQNYIAICLLAVYSLVLTHNFVPHHHHSSNFTSAKHDHQHDDHHHHYHLYEIDMEHECIDHSHQHEAHVHCSFEEVTIPGKKISLSTFYALAVLLEIELNDQGKQLFADTYIVPHPTEPKCRDVQLRGPPQLS
jgi:hypothetical protein